EEDNMTDDNPTIGERVTRRKQQPGAPLDRAPVIVTRDGTFRCAECRDQLPDQWQGYDHHGIRFEMDPEVPLQHRQKTLNVRQGKAAVFLDDRDVTAETLEFLTGDNGWCAMYARNRDGKRFMCANPLGIDDHPVYTIEFGRVEIRERVA
ncbi:MAG: hypothetical protein ACRD0W_06825, partial [Acidimicrobiales bacterium]